MDIVSSHERETILAEIYKLSVGSEGDLDSFLEGCGTPCSLVIQLVK